MMELRSYGLIGGVLATLPISSLWAQSAPSDLGAETQKICEQASAIDAGFSDQLTELGWLPLAIGDTTRFAGVITDGVMATLTGGPGERKNWSSIYKESGDFVSSFLTLANNNADVLTFIAMKPKTSALAIWPRDEIARGAIQCVYSGAIGPETEDYLNTLARLDARAGLVQANPDVNIFHVQSSSISPENGGTAKVLDIVYGHYQGADDMKSWRYSGSDYAFSLVRYGED